MYTKKDLILHAKSYIDKNYNDDIMCGCVLLKREAISEIRKYFYMLKN